MAVWTAREKANFIQKVLSDIEKTRIENKAKTGQTAELEAELAAAEAQAAIDEAVEGGV